MTGKLKPHSDPFVSSVEPWVVSFNSSMTLFAQYQNKLFHGSSSFYFFQKQYRIRTSFAARPAAA
jgi:hypothetical protein